MMRKLLTEFIGTFFLVSGAAFGGAIGASVVLMAMIYAGGHISGAHYNPAVTVAMLIRRKIAPNEAIGYVISQLVAGALAGVVACCMLDNHGLIECNFLAGTGKALFAEVIGTFALAYVVLNVATARGTTGNSYFGIAIAGTVYAMAWIFGSFSNGGVFNPAVVLGLTIQQSFCWKVLWLFFVGPVVGGVIAAFAFRLVNGADSQPESIPNPVEPIRR